MLALLLALAVAAPTMVGPGTISTVDDEFGFAPSPDGARALFVKRTPTTNSRPLLVVCESRRTARGWGTPVVAAFSGTFTDYGVAWSPDGRRVYFTSDRPHDGAATGPAADLDLWTCDVTPGGFGPPRRLPAPVNTDASEAWPSVALDGTLYFASTRPGGKGGVDLWRAAPSGDGFAAPVNLAGLNTEASETQPAIAPDQSFLVFTGVDRHDMAIGKGARYPRPDLYLARAPFTSDVRLPAPIGSDASDVSPVVSADGRTLWFASERGFAAVPMRRRLTARAFGRGRASLENGMNNVWSVPVSSLP